MRPFCAIAIALTTVLITGCGDSHEKVMSASIKNQKRLNDALEDIGDSDESVTAAGEALSEYLSELGRIHNRAERLGTPSLKTQTKLNEKFEEKRAAEIERSHKLFAKLEEEIPKFTQKLQRAVKEAQAGL